MDIQLITHCWSGTAVPIYHKLLKLQIISLIDAAKDASVSVSLVVAYNVYDRNTSRVIKQAEWLDQNHLELLPLPLEESELFRRAYGRNQAALATKADVVWFTDCDHLFTSAGLEQAVAWSKQKPAAMIWPKHVMIHKDHATGDAFIEHEFAKREKIGWRSLTINKDDFLRRQERRAIGGLQIVSGDFCRERGYLNNTAWIEPAKDKRHFQQCRCDVPFRRQFTSKIACEMDYIYRVRHSRTGRDDGKKDHSR